MVFFKLSNEERIQVLLVALALFLAALVLAICIGATLCPLNKWLHRRHSIKRKKQRQLQLGLGARHQQQHNGTNRRLHQNAYSMRSGPFGSKSGAACPAFSAAATVHNYGGPPPAYEVALRASRLQSLTGNNLVSAAPNWLESAQLAAGTSQQEEEEATKLDLGDYFHPPKETLPFGMTAADHVMIPISSSDQQQQQQQQQQQAPANRSRQPPVMLRLWVRLMEPGELVARARELANKSQQLRCRSAASSASSRRLSLTRQLSIPQLFGSLMNLAASTKPTESLDTSRPVWESPSLASNELNEPKDNEMSSLASSTNSSSTAGNNGQQVSEMKPNHCEENQNQAQDQATASKLEESNQPKTLPGQQAEESKHQLEEADQQAGPTWMGAATAAATKPVGQGLGRLLSPVGSITSRVLHMNVASFSYVKDETLISTKKHNQLNYHHFCAPQNKSSFQDKQQHQLSGKSSNKMCQILVSICDIENLLNYCWLSERACTQLSQSSSIYIRCDILSSKGSKSARLLRNPLRVLQHQSSSASLHQHTVDFAATIPAAAIDPTPTISVSTPGGPMAPAPATLLANNAEQATEDSLTSPLRSMGEPPTSLTTDTSSADSLQPQTTGASSAPATSTNWRHEPSADGKSIVIFNSVPKQIAHQQQLAAANLHNNNNNNNGMSTESLDNCIDLIQFDSVFVSPILSRSTVENGYIRLRICSQCKYVNESCLAELKLPLKQLAKSATRDNLGDVSLGAGPQHQADLILNNLLANLVTASTGSPLSTLIEQISGEELEEERDESCGTSLPPGGHIKQQEQADTGSSSFRLPWPIGGAGAGSSSEPNESQLQRSACSLNEGLHQLDGAGDWRHHAQSSDTPLDGARAGDDWRIECDKLVEQNYCRSLLVSHWLNYLVAPSYECQLVEEQLGKLILGLTYLPTSNRVIFNAHRASIDLDSLGSKQLAKNLRLQSDTSYLLRLFMVANGRVLKRKQTGAARKPEWDSQEGVTFDLVNVSVEQPSFIVALVMRNARTALATGSLQSLSSCGPGAGAAGGPAPDYYVGGLAGQRGRPATNCSGSGVQSEPESLRHFATTNTANDAICRHDPQQRPASGRPNSGRDLVIGHLVLADEIWRELRAQPRRQIVKQFKLH